MIVARSETSVTDDLHLYVAVSDMLSFPSPSNIAKGVAPIGALHRIGVSFCMCAEIMLLPMGVNCVFSVADAH
jgi:hypothetical protein